MRNLEVKNGGALWFTDLSVPDPYYVLPIVGVALTYFNLQRGVTTENADWFINRIRGMIQIWLIASLPITVQWPAVSSTQGIFCYWVASAAFTIVQSRVLAMPAIRDWINPTLMQDLQQLSMRNHAVEDAQRLVAGLRTGETGYIKINEHALVKNSAKYIKKQGISR